MISRNFTAEAIHNAAGLGLHYVDGKPSWDLTCNVRISKVLVCTSLVPISLIHYIGVRLCQTFIKFRPCRFGKSFNFIKTDIKVHSHRGKVEVKMKIFFDGCRLSSFICFASSFIIFTSTFAFACCE